MWCVSPGNHELSIVRRGFPFECIGHTCCSYLRRCLQGLLQRAPDRLSPGQDYSQLLCFCEEASQALLQQRLTRVGSTAADAVADWLAIDDVLLVNDGQVAGGGRGSSRGSSESGGPDVSRPLTAVVG